MRKMIMRAAIKRYNESQVEAVAVVVEPVPVKKPVTKKPVKKTAKVKK